MDTNYNHFVCIVAGENPEELIKQYGDGDGREEFIAYKFADASFLKRNHIKLYRALIERETDEFKKMLLQDELDTIIEDTDAEYFARVTEGYEHNENGDAIRRDNPNAKFHVYNRGNSLSIPFQLNNGDEEFQARKKDICWENMHISEESAKPYRLAWELVMEKKKPENEYEEMIFKNMKDMTHYFNHFGTKEHYVASCCSFWGYAFLSEKTGWVELEPEMDQYEWVSCFYEKFIVPLQPETLLTIYECRRD